jgi:hypothetical protein
MTKSELTPQQVREKLQRAVATWRKWAWLMKVNMFLSLAIFLVSTYAGETQSALIFLFAFTGCAIVIVKYNSYKLILKLAVPVA